MAIKDLTKVQKIIFICNGGTCNKDNAADANTVQLRTHLTENDLNDEIHTVRTKCLGQCTWGPMLFMHPEGLWYKNVNLDTTREIVTQHLMKNELVLEHVHFPEAALVDSKPLTLPNPQPNE